MLTNHSVVHNAAMVAVVVSHFHRTNPAKIQMHIVMFLEKIFGMVQRNQ